MPLEVDFEGYLVDPSLWSERVAEELARHVMKHMAEHKGPGKAGRNDLFVLFPYGYVKQACKIAGMRKPRAWSTG